MAFRETKFPVIISDVVSLLSHVIHENVDIVEINVVILYDILPLQDPLAVMLDEFIRKALSVKGDTSCRRIVQDRDILRLVSALGMSDDGHHIIFQMQLFVDTLVPLKRIDLLQGIHLVCSLKIIHPLIAGRTAECDDGFHVTVV